MYINVILTNTIHTERHFRSVVGVNHLAITANHWSNKT